MIVKSNPLVAFKSCNIHANLRQQKRGKSECVFKNRRVKELSSFTETKFTRSKHQYMI